MIPAGKGRNQMDEAQRAAFQTYCDTVQREVATVCHALDYKALRQAADWIAAAQKSSNRLHISGIGKPEHIARYAASLFSSTGTPAYFLHGTEAVHGSCGQLVQGDVVIFISNSGETAEMQASVSAIRNNGCTVIGISGNGNSWLASNSALHLSAHIDAEGGPLNRAPRASILAEMIVLQALSVILQAGNKISPQQYVKWHPGGSLGKLRRDEQERR